MRKEEQKRFAIRLLQQERRPSFGQGLLGDLSIRKETIVDYTRRLRGFFAFLDERGGSFAESEAQKCDRQLTAYVNRLFAQGEAAPEGDKLKAAIEAFYPDFSRRGPFGLPMMCRALKGWEKHFLPLPNYAMPEVVKDAICDRLIEMDEKEVSL